MSWQHEDLWNKAKLFFSKAFELEKNDEFFGLWSAMGLELLARSALSFKSPVLLAENDKDQKHILSALGLGGQDKDRRSISITVVLRLCTQLIPEFDTRLNSIASSLISRRNEDLHSGSAAFAEYPTSIWLSHFYMCCKVLAEFQEKTIEELLSVEEADHAKLLISELTASVEQNTRDKINLHKKLFLLKEQEEKEELMQESEVSGTQLSTMGHHRIPCPACECTATVTGNPFGTGRTISSGDEIIEKQEMIPDIFRCSACGLKLLGVATLFSAGVGQHYYKTVKYEPHIYYQLYTEDDLDEARREGKSDAMSEFGIMEFNNE